MQQISSYALLQSTDNTNTLTPPPPDLHNEPISFIADTDIITYAVDSGANYFILNDSHYMSNMKITKASIKGIGGKALQMSGSGDHSLLLKSDDGDFDIIPEDHPAVYVLSSPYNLIPPHLLSNICEE